jgi:hypothetical protein
MKYEFLLQPREVGQPYAPELVDSALAGRGVTQRPDGVWVWRMTAGEIEARHLLENGKAIATELKVPFSDKPDLVRQAVEEATAMAESVGLRVIDPQLNRTLTGRDAEAVAEEFMRNARYAGEYMGVSEALGASYTPKQEDQGLKPQTKILLAAIMFAVVMFITWRVIIG